MRARGLAGGAGVAASAVLAFGQGDRPPVRTLEAGAGVLAGLSLAGGTSFARGERPPPRLLENGHDVVPLRVAPAAFENGVVQRTGDWVGYSRSRGGHDLCHDYRVFDCYGDHDWDGVPDDRGGCGQGGARWWFGTGYCNLFFTNDMTLAPDALGAEGLWRADIAWHWTCAGHKSQQCVLAIFMQSSDARACEPDSFDLPGWLVDFGDLWCNQPYYFRASIDISGIGRWELSDGGAGSYSVMYLTDDGAAPAACAQPMLWGGPNSSGGDPDGPGAQWEAQIDDDAPADLVHELPTECYTYAFGCPDPLGAMAQLWGERLDPPGNRADFNGDGAADTRDVIAFLAAWRLCADGVDCDGDGRCTTMDVLCFLDRWIECR